MKGVVGALALLVVLAIVGLVMVRQTRTVAASRVALPAALGEPQGQGQGAASAPSGSARQTEQQVTRDIGAAFEAASATRARSADQ